MLTRKFFEVVANKIYTSEDHKYTLTRQYGHYGRWILSDTQTGERLDSAVYRHELAERNKLILFPHGYRVVTNTHSREHDQDQDKEAMECMY